ncbi:Zinc metalloproteinase-disintegrin-like [Hondaea fermentalgiana]|uniref:Zinc metalloproteinase-disintegrin-like n=1 Tax=Hondaea fermentalgiana TaxID=2315210 RepID=A0A2R5G2N6_9STRA|nr:Zinc metalloproteinase-disintegrin-like [Hondaea fermentalgiana]|eukprot:GBG25286.1 Zinc metalloproteinase-disintegrin-like [Hondaea fermentalgiana]
MGAARLLATALLAVAGLAAQSEARLKASGEDSRDLLDLDRKLLDKIQEYEVVDDLLPSHEHRRLLSAETTDFSLSAFGEPHNFELEVHRNLFDANFKNVGVGRDGKPILLNEEKDCVYRGANKTTFSFCGGVVHGRFQRDGDFVHVKPLPSGRHVIFKRRHLETAEPGHCGITDANEKKLDVSGSNIIFHRDLAHDHDHAHSEHVHDHVHVHEAAHAGKSGRVLAEEELKTDAADTKRKLATNRNVDILVFNDKLRYDEYGYGIFANTAYIVSLVADLYEDLPGDNVININLVATFVFTEEDPWTISMTNGGASVDADTLLNLFSDYMGEKDDDVSAFVTGEEDHAMLLSGYDFYDDDASSDGVVGLAWVGGLCKEGATGPLPAPAAARYTGITQADFDDEKYVANIFAHELGHNLGMQHTNVESTDYAPNSPCNAAADEVMDPSASYEPEWSSCTHEYWQAKLDGDMTYDATCTEAASDTIVAGLCGNGVVDPGEDCDCLFNDCTGVDACCNEADCTFAGSSVCSELDPCCVNSGGTCSVQTDTAVVCRASADATCDPSPETCDGSNAKCPTDVVAASGTACDNDGKCFLGKCVNYEDQCIDNGYANGECGFANAETGLYQWCSGYVRCASTGGGCQSPPYYPADGSPCESDGQCYGRVCVTDSSALPTPADIEQCSNGVLDGSESDVDCGGDFCYPCTAGKICATDDDCLFPSFCNETTLLCDVTDYYPEFDGEENEDDWTAQLLGLWAKFLDWVQNNTALAAGIFAGVGFILVACLVSCCCCGGKEKTRQYAQQASFRMRGDPRQEQQVATASPYY